MEHLDKSLEILNSLHKQYTEWIRDKDKGMQYQEVCAECGGEPGGDDYGHISECRTCWHFNKIYSAIDHLNCLKRILK
jgi:hypothetical protein